jgi:hypothetical protein
MALTNQDRQEIRDAIDQRVTEAEQRIRTLLRRRTRCQRDVPEGWSVNNAMRKSAQWERLVSPDGRQIIERRVKR